MISCRQILPNLCRAVVKKNTRRGFFKLSKNKKDFGACNVVEIGEVSPERAVPDHIRKPEYYFQFMRPGSTLGVPEIKNHEQVHRMRSSCKLAARILASCEHLVQKGTKTDEIDAFVHDQIIAANAYPSPLRYAGFPKSICTSVNNVACHGIPDNRALLDGDMINVDITVFYNGYHGDCSKTFLVGNVDERGRYLIECTEKCLKKCIELCAPGVPFSAIGRLITQYCKEKDLGVLPAFSGHGIGSYFHGPPEICHYKNNMPGHMQPNMTFTIEPILTLGGPDIEIQEDGWTAMTVDGARSAQFEHTVLITEQGAEILTI
ncbi:methionine aminopeptidase 1D, mitochondrial [Teleopsis dalmanni]|uniref:methionine aminopeptidase 1D, mitochondrial n=1 Tax=Teleopsis dalmanni TaxID=139649 RepID=UPI0018CEF0EF|nr:methionine aminopeptidase 1D, mitochondrial [Teleopsis dalmanni]